MSLQNGKNINIAGAGNQSTGFSLLNTVNVNSAATTISLRKTSGAGTIVAQFVTTAANTQWQLNFGDGLLCDSGTWFLESTAGNITGGVTGLLIA
jgi:hypothetical protein